MIIINWHWC